MGMLSKTFMEHRIVTQENKYILMGILLAVLSGVAIAHGYWVYLGLAVIGILLCWITIEKPFLIYLLMISLLSLEGFPSLPGVSYVKIIGILLVMGLCLRLAVTKESFSKDSSYKYFFMFFIGGLVSLAVAKNISVSLTTYITYISLFCLYIITRYFLKSLKDINTALDVMFIITIVSFAVVQLMGLSVRANYAGPRISSGIGDPNEFASYILVLLPLVFYRVIQCVGTLRVFYWGILGTFLMLVIYSGSRGGMLGFSGAAVVLIYHYGYRNIKQLFFFAILMVLILYFFMPEDYWILASSIFDHQIEEEYQGTSISSRILSYKAAFQMFLDYPLTGVGLYNFQFNAVRYGAMYNMVVHNTYLEILTGGGLLGLIPFSLLLINNWRMLKLKISYDKSILDLLICLKASFVSILITSYFISGDHKKILWLLFAFISSVHYLAENQCRLRARGVKLI